MTHGRTRLKDIAKLAGVSIGTVDRVIHDRGEVSEKTKLRVRQILQETNYSPDLTAQVLKSQKIFRLASLLPEPSDDNAFWKKHPAGIQKAIGELNLFRVSFHQVGFDMSDEKDFQLKAYQILDSEPDGVLLAPIFKAESDAFCRQLRGKKIPYVFVDSFIENTGFLAFIGEDAFRSGRVAGQLADMITPGNQNIAIVSIARNIKNVQHLNNRVNGFISYFATRGSIRGNNIMISISDSSPGSIEEAMDKAFAANPSITTIYMSGSKSFLIATYLENKKLNNVQLIGYDLLDNNVGFLKSGLIRFLIGQRPEEQTYKAVRKLFEFLSFNRIPDEKEYLPVDIITSENVDFFM
jgi:LacI family transcriptional regulator